MRSTRIVEGCKALCFLSVAFFAVAWGIAGLQVYSQVSGLGATVTKANLVLDEAHRGVLEVSLAAMEARKASKEQRQTLEIEVPKTFADVHKTLGTVNESVIQSGKLLRSAQIRLGDVTAHTLPLLDASTATVISTQRLTEQATRTLATTEGAIAHTDALIQSPDLKASLQNLNRVSAESARVASNLQTASDSISHPHGFGRLLHWLW